MNEATARGALATMRDRLDRGPHAVLDVAPTATAAQVRTAFLELTKQYHPVRFGRMSDEIQRMANEVFLGIKSAHDALKHGAAGPTNPANPTTATGIAVTRTSTSQGIPRPTSLGMPPLRTPQPPPAGPVVTKQPTLPLPVVQPPPPRAGTGGIPRIEPAGRERLPSSGAPKIEKTTIGHSPVAAVTRPPAPAANGVKIARSHRTTSTADPAVRKPGTAATTDKSFPRIETQPGLAARRTDRPDHRLDPNTTMPPAPSVQVAMELLANRQWDAAKVALSALSAMAPDSQHVRALMCFAAGRQAQVEGRLDEARVDLQRALQFDPELAPAKSALAELFVRRR